MYSYICSKNSCTVIIFYVQDIAKATATCLELKGRWLPMISKESVSIWLLWNIIILFFFPIMCVCKIPFSTILSQLSILKPQRTTRKVHGTVWSRIAYCRNKGNRLLLSHLSSWKIGRGISMNSPFNGLHAGQKNFLGGGSRRLMQSKWYHSSHWSQAIMALWS